VHPGSRQTMAALWDAHPQHDARREIVALD